jgi:hypothetical protein
MAYGKFQTLEEVGSKFDIERKIIEFLEESSLKIEELFFQYLQNNLKNPRNYISENSVCEMVIAPTLALVAEKHNLPIWSHVRFDVSETDGLTGVPDFLLAPTSKTGFTFTSPVVCVAEVKRENFEEGWTQALSEMIAAQKFNKTTEKPIYGIATSGAMWQFGKLLDKELIMDPRIYSATLNLQQVLDVLNWFLGEAKKSLP